MIKQLKLETNLSLKEFRKFQFYAVYLRPIGMILIVIGATMSLVVINYLATSDSRVANFPFLQAGFAIFVFVLTLLVTYWSLRQPVLC